jgi:hypothetical protein
MFTDATTLRFASETIDHVSFCGFCGSQAERGDECDPEAWRLTAVWIVA